MGKIIIKLISDLCVASGDVFNSTIDTDVCYDSYGLPYIPAKRLKGCLRERALELADWGYISEEMIAKIFGDKGEAASSFQLSNAYLENYECYIDDLKNLKDYPLGHPQNILNNFSYVRAQTAIDSDTGSAMKTSLRTMRVIKKELTFIAEVHISDTNKEKLEQVNDILSLGCKALRRMGVSRTRGFGEIQVQYEPMKEETDSMTDIWKGPFASEHNKCNYIKIDYIITLNGPVLFKSICGGQQKTQNYVEGSKILGILAGKLKKHKRNDLFIDLVEKGHLICSNSYLSQGQERFEPMPVSLYKKKGGSEYKKVIEKTEKEEKRTRTFLDVIDESSDGKENLNRKAKVDSYFIHNGNAGKVMREIHYHHSRGLDKSIGRAVKENGDSEFYQMESLSSGQCFAGYLLVDRQYEELVRELLKEDENIRLGNAKGAEYGDCTLKIMEREESVKETILVSRFTLKLNSPVILYNQYGMYSTQIQDLIQELEQKLNEIFAEEQGKIELILEKRYLKYTKTGGFNITWKMQKPTIDVLDMGAVCVFGIRNDKKIDLSKCNDLFVGERNAEGYGEIKLASIHKEKKLTLTLSERVKTSKTLDNMEDYHWKSDLFSQLILNEQKKNIKERGIQAANEFFPQLKENMEKARAVVEWLLLIFKEHPCYEKVMVCK